MTFQDEVNARVAQDEKRHNEKWPNLPFDRDLAILLAEEEIIEARTRGQQPR